MSRVIALIVLVALAYVGIAITLAVLLRKPNDPPTRP